MPTITFHHPDGTEQRVNVTDDTTVMRAAVSNGVDGIVGECGGQAMCATCHVYVRPEHLNVLPEVSEEEDEMLECTAAERLDRSRLGCQIPVNTTTPELTVDVPYGQI